jgi:hypothetical protein
MRSTMNHPTSLIPSPNRLGQWALSFRDRVARLDVETAAVKTLLAGLVIGFASLLVMDHAPQRDTGTRAELLARIAPVGSVTLAADAQVMQALQTGTENAVAMVANDS